MVFLFIQIFPQESIELLEKRKNTAGEREKIDILIKLGLEYDRVGEYNKSMDCFESALKISSKLQDTLKIAELVYNIGMVWDTKGDFDLAQPKYFEALRIYESINNQEGIIQSLLGIANIDRLKYNFDEALVHLQRADSLSIVSKNKSLILNTALNFGTFYLKLTDYPKALRFLTKALHLAFEIDDKTKTARISGFLGVLFSLQKDYKTSNDYYNKSLEIRKKINDVAGIASSYNNIGENYFDMKDYKKALEYFNKAFELRVQTQNKYGIAQTQNNLGDLYIKMGQYDKALGILRESNAFAIKENIIQIQIQNHILISEAYRLKNNFKDALENYTIHSKLKDSVSLADHNKRINDLLQKVEIKKHETEIEKLKNIEIVQGLELESQSYQILWLLTAALFLTIIVLILLTKSRLQKKHQQVLEEKNEEISEQKAELEELNATKDKFFTIIAHDLKNPFNALLGFSQILRDNFYELNDMQKLDIINDINNSSMSSYKLLQNLLDWSRSNTGKIEIQPSLFSIKEVIRETVCINKSSIELKNISIDTKLEGELNIKTDINIFNTIIRNILSNAIKYTNHGGQIIISALRTGHKYEIEIIDNGLGMSEDTVNSLFDISKQNSRNGTNNEKGTGIGLILCKELIGLLGGSIQVKSKIGQGSCFKIIVPEAF